MSGLARVSLAFRSLEERNDRIAELWCEGLTATAVSVIVGCTRNAVIGVAHRRGLSNKSGKRRILATVPPVPKPQVFRSVVLSIDPRSRVSPSPVRNLPPLPAPVAPVPVNKTRRFVCLADALVAHTGGCRWPCEDDLGHWVCGGRRFETLRSKIPHSYCAEHYRMSVGRGTDSERRAMQLPKGEK